MKKNNHLTRKQQQVLVLSAQGYAQKEIADQLGVSLKTVVMRRQEIFRKLGAKNIAHAVYRAVKKGIIQ